MFAQRPLGEDGFQYFIPNLFKYKVKTIEPNSRGCSDGENIYRSGLCLGAFPTDINNIKRKEREREKKKQPRCKFFKVDVLTSLLVPAD